MSCLRLASKSLDSVKDQMVGVFLEGLLTLRLMRALKNEGSVHFMKK